MKACQQTAGPIAGSSAGSHRCPDKDWRLFSLEDSALQQALQHPSPKHSTTATSQILRRGMESFQSPKKWNSQTKVKITRIDISQSVLHSMCFPCSNVSQLQKKKKNLSFTEALSHLPFVTGVGVGKAIASQCLSQHFALTDEKIPGSKQ